MPPTLQSLGIDRLSVADRILLIEAIWDSVTADVTRETDETEPAHEGQLTEAQKLDLQRRMIAHEANPRAGSTWEEVKTRLLNRA